MAGRRGQAGFRQGVALAGVEKFVLRGAGGEDALVESAYPGELDLGVAAALDGADEHLVQSWRSEAKGLLAQGRGKQSGDFVEAQAFVAEDGVQVVQSAA